MRELTKIETEEVSGAGFIADAGQALGEGIGAVVDACKGNIEGGGTNAGGMLGRGIGAVVEAGLGILGGLFGRRR